MLIHQKILSIKLKLVLNILIIVIFSYLSSCTHDRKSNERDNYKVTNPIEIALLLPLGSQSNDTNTLARHFENAAQLAVIDLKHHNLVISTYPTSADNEIAVQAAKTALEEGAQVLIGPIFSGVTAAVKAALKKEKIIIISFSNDPSVAGKAVFIMGTTFKSTANRLVAFALSRGFERIAVIGPEGTLGLDGIEAAKSAIVSNGAIITTISTYPLSAKEISKVAPKIYSELVNTNSEAIIFTDTPTRGLAFITEQLAQLFENDDEKSPKFMGTTRWDSSPQILDESSLNKGWFIVPDQRFKKQYSNRYQKTFGVVPSEISSLSYDAVALIGGILKKTNFKTLPPLFLNKHFLDQNGFLGVNGIFRFTSQGTNERSLSVAEVDSNGYKIIDAAKNRFLQINETP